MKKDILFPVALNEKWELCYAKDAPKNATYYCVECKGKMILRRSEAGLRRPHFAHKKLSPGCYPETVLHNVYKNLLFERIENAIARKEPLYMEWKCSVCGSEHKINLSEGIDDALLEAHIGEYKPDIVLLKGGEPVYAVEIVVSHEPTVYATQHYASKNIQLVKIMLETEEELYKLNEEVLRPASVEYCPVTPRCPNCGSYMEPAYLNITTSKCWHCGTPHKKCWITVGDGTFYGPEQFTQEEINLAKEKGVLIEKRYSRSLEEWYNANVCPRCGKFHGQLFIHDLLYLEDEKYFLGYKCPYCLQRE